MQDQISFEPNEHDVKVTREGWHYWVRAVKSGQPLKSDVFKGGDLFDEVLNFMFGSLHQRWLDGRETWKVGILAYRDSGWGGRFKVLHKELLAPGLQPDDRIAQLVNDVEAGRFHPSRS
ncbi:hypothetical protein [Nocardioides sp.]|uniref:hypothetical protein n=1 Tax=Nocardioides sp. TaxID=35761 RepID=UPI002CFA41F6|nr:hypothetical protein [Nocardioides sp.]HSX67403.1 hypothetical protein [Nocardioides sp.]